MSQRQGCDLTAGRTGLVVGERFSPTNTAAFDDNGEEGKALYPEQMNFFQEEVRDGFNHRGHGPEFLQSLGGVWIHIFIFSVWSNKPKTREAV